MRNEYSSHRHMARSKASVPRAYFLLLSVLALERCLPAQSFGPRHLSLAASSRSIRPYQFAQRTRLQQDINTICASWPPSAGGRRGSSFAQPRMSSHSHRPSFSSSPPKEASIARAIFKGWAASLLCVASLFAGPDVLRIGDEVASAAGLGLLLPPPASALSEEQVGVLIRSPRHW